jgi:membrane-associated phospholipid phosphatase
VHGCAVDLAAHASEGPNLARVDAWLGVPYFAGMYGRASDVFGAMPSLHVAYALIVVLVGWPSLPPLWRAASLAFFFLMTFAAVYLDHHWVLDAVAGIVYCTTVVTVACLLERLRVSKAISAPTVAVAESSAPRGVS